MPTTHSEQGSTRHGIVTFAAKTGSIVAIIPGARHEQMVKTGNAGMVTAKLDMGDVGLAVVTANVLKAQLKN